MREAAQALGLVPQGISVKSVSPGRAVTLRAISRAQQMAAAEGLPVEAIYECVTLDIPLRRYGTAEEVAAMVAFLASPFSTYTTGQNVLVDGGLYLGAYEHRVPGKAVDTFLSCAVQPLQQRPVQRRPNPSRLSVAQPPRASHAAPATQLGGSPLATTSDARPDV